MQFCENPVYEEYLSAYYRNRSIQGWFFSKKHTHKKIIENKGASPSNTNTINNNEKNSFKLVLNSVEHEVCSDSNNFYIKQPVSEGSVKFNKLSINQPRKYSLMTPQEAKLDKEITNCIQQGKHYSHIENKLSVFLKVPSPDINKPNNNNKID